MRRHLLISAVLCMSAAACDESLIATLQRTIVFTSQRAEYGPNDTITLNVRNSSEATAYVECPVLERDAGVGWEPVIDPQQLCENDVSRPLRAASAGGAGPIFQQRVAAWMPSGEYRYRIDVGFGSGDSVGIISSTFSIAQ